WYQYNITYDGITSKIYRNGELLKSTDGISRLTKGYILRLGQLNATISINADVDDLKIYNVAMTQEQVMESYNSSKATSTAVVAESAPVTAPVKKVVVAATTTKPAVIAKTTPAVSVASTTEANTGSKNVEVFSQGKKVFGSTNATNINDLPEGTYLLKITNMPSKK
ncbi:MAG: LamG-like jellyroll fold domain-containing protein, partial [Flavobacterium sp.]